MALIFICLFLDLSANMFLSTIIDFPVILDGQFLVWL
jgi:hypothetical protein